MFIMHSLATSLFHLWVENERGFPIRVFSRCYLRIETLMVTTCTWCWLFALVSRVSWILLSQDWDSDGHYMYLMLTLCSCFTCLLNSAISGLRLWWSLHVLDADSVLLFHVSPKFCYLRIETLMVSATCIWCWLFALVSRVSWILLSQDWDSDGQCYLYLMLTLCSCFTCLLNSAISGLRLWWSLHVLDADSLLLFHVSPKFCYLRIETLMVTTCIWCWLFALVSHVSWILLSQDWDSDGHYMYLMLTLCSCFTCLLNSAISGLRLWWSLHVCDADSLLLFHVSPEFCSLRIETLMVTTCTWCWVFVLVWRVSWILLSQDWDSDGHYMYLMLTLCSCLMCLLNSAVSGLRLWWSLHVLDADSLPGDHIAPTLI